MLCAECKLEFPPEILSPYVTEHGTTDPVCGICALRLSNQHLGIKREQFHGPIAESYRLRAIEINSKRQGGSR